MARRHRGRALIGMLMADSRHSLWDNSDERHLLFRTTEGRREGMYLLPAAINFIYAMRQGYDFIHFKVVAPAYAHLSLTDRILMPCLHHDSQELCLHVCQIQHDSAGMCLQQTE